MPKSEVRVVSYLFSYFHLGIVHFHFIVIIHCVLYIIFRCCPFCPNSPCGWCLLYVAGATQNKIYLILSYQDQRVSDFNERQQYAPFQISEDENNKNAFKSFASWGRGLYHLEEELACLESSGLIVRGVTWLCGCFTELPRSSVSKEYIWPFKDQYHQTCACWCPIT